MSAAPALPCPRCQQPVTALGDDALLCPACGLKTTSARQPGATPPAAASSSTSPAAASSAGQVKPTPASGARRLPDPLTVLGVGFVFNVLLGVVLLYAFAAPLARLVSSEPPLATGSVVAPANPPRNEDYAAKIEALRQDALNKQADLEQRLASAEAQRDDAIQKAQKSQPTPSVAPPQPALPPVVEKPKPRPSPGASERLQTELQATRRELTTERNRAAQLATQIEQARPSNASAPTSMWAEYREALKQAEAALRAGRLDEARSRLDSCAVPQRGWEWRRLAVQLPTLVGKPYSLREFLGGRQPRDVSLQLSGDGRFLLFWLQVGNQLKTGVWNIENGEPTLTTRPLADHRQASCSLDESGQWLFVHLTVTDGAPASPASGELQVYEVATQRLHETIPHVAWVDPQPGFEYVGLRRYDANNLNKCRTVIWQANEAETPFLDWEQTPAHVAVSRSRGFVSSTPRDLDRPPRFYSPTGVAQDSPNFSLLDAGCEALSEDGSLAFGRLVNDRQQEGRTYRAGILVMYDVGLSKIVRELGKAAQRSSRQDNSAIVQRDVVGWATTTPAGTTARWWNAATGAELGETAVQAVARTQPVYATLEGEEIVVRRVSPAATVDRTLRKLEDEPLGAWQTAVINDNGLMTVAVVDSTAAQGQLDRDERVTYMVRPSNSARVALAPNASFAYLLANFPRVERLNLTDGQVSEAFTVRDGAAPSQEIAGVWTSPDGSTLAVLLDGGLSDLWASDGTVRARSTKATADAARPRRLSNDYHGRTAASPYDSLYPASWLVSADGRMFGYPVASGVQLAFQNGPVDVLNVADLRHAACTHHGNIVPLPATDDNGKLLILGAGPQPIVKQLSTAGMSFVAFSPDDQRLFVTTADGWLRVFETQTWEEVYSISTGALPLGPPVVSPNGRFVAAPVLGGRNADQGKGGVWGLEVWSDGLLD